MLTRHETSAHAGVDHGAPPPGWLLPERIHPRELPVLDHPLVAAPGRIGEDVKPSMLAADPLEHGRHCFVVRVVARHAYDTVRQRGIRDRPAGGVDTGPGIGQGGGDATADAAAGAGDERGFPGQQSVEDHRSTLLPPEGGSHR